MVLSSSSFPFCWGELELLPTAERGTIAPYPLPWDLRASAKRLTDVCGARYGQDLGGSTRKVKEEVCWWNFLKTNKRFSPCSCAKLPQLFSWITRLPTSGYTPKQAVLTLLFLQLQLTGRGLAQIHMASPAICKSYLQRGAKVRNLGSLEEIFPENICNVVYTLSLVQWCAWKKMLSGLWLTLITAFCNLVPVDLRRSWTDF